MSIEHQIELLKLKVRLLEMAESAAKEEQRVGYSEGATATVATNELWEGVVRHMRTMDLLESTKVETEAIEPEYTSHRLNSMNEVFSNPTDGMMAICRYKLAWGIATYFKVDEAWRITLSHGQTMMRSNPGRLYPFPDVNDMWEG